MIYTEWNNLKWARKEDLSTVFVASIGPARLIQLFPRVLLILPFIINCYFKLLCKTDHKLLDRKETGSALPSNFLMLKGSAGATGCWCGAAGSRSTARHWSHSVNGSRIDGMCPCALATSCPSEHHLLVSRWIMGKNKILWNRNWMGRFPEGEGEGRPGETDQWLQVLMCLSLVIRYSCGCLAQHTLFTLALCFFFSIHFIYVAL